MNDGLRKIALDGIERHSKWLVSSANEIIHFVGMLEFRRSYLTEVEDAMNEADKALREATTKINEAQQSYNNLRKES